MLNKLMKLYDACFPNIVRVRSTVEKVLSFPENHVVLREEAGETVAAAVINGNVILMLCVLPQWQGKGIGSALLQEAEAYIRGNGHAEVRFCDGPEYITPGVPNYDGVWNFFKKRGYVHSWGESECVDMSMALKDFSLLDHAIGDTLKGFTYRWATIQDLPAITACVDDAWDSFTGYYQDPKLYDPQHDQRVLIATEGDLVCGTLIVSIESEQAGVGSVGCTATRNAYQGRGIATTMVKLGTRYLYEIGLPKAFLGYTYTGIIEMYGRAGYQVCMKYMMAVKTLE